MNTNIFVPKRINVGFQNRSDTYTGKLAYVIYFDEKGKLRKEASWNSWRNTNIDNEIYDNEPTEGFVLNKKVGGVEECWGWDPRKTYTRVYDPRGFEFEITIPNLLWILENCNCIKGKGLEGEFVYGWDGKELLLVPVDSADYKEIARKNEIFHSNNFIKAKDLKIGATYIDKNDRTYVYMGKFEHYDHGYWKNEIFFPSHHKMVAYCRENNITSYTADRYSYGPVGKKHCFYYTYKDYRGTEVSAFEWRPSLSKFLIGTIDDKCHSNYAEYFDLLECSPSYSLPDSSKATYHEMSFERFFNANTDHRNLYYYTSYFYSNVNGQIERFKMASHSGKNEFSVYKVVEGSSDSIEVLNIFPTEIKEEPSWSYYKKKVTHMIPVTLEEVYNKMHPMYKQTYLTNGKEYRKEY